MLICTLLTTRFFQANVSGFFTAYLFSYILQSKLVFLHEVNMLKALKYFAVQFSSLCTSMLISSLLVMEANQYAQTIIIAFLLPIITFMSISYGHLKLNKRNNEK